MRCERCGHSLKEVKRVVETARSTPGQTLVVAGYASTLTGKQSCKRGGPHKMQRPEQMTSEEIWGALNSQEDKYRGL